MLAEWWHLDGTRLAYDLLTGNDEATLRILDNVIYLAVPCFN